MEKLILKDMVMTPELCTPATTVTNYMEMSTSHVTTADGRERYPSVNVSEKLSAWSSYSHILIDMNEPPISKYYT